MARICNASNGKPQQQTIRADQWTKEKRERFLDLLAATGNASYSARQVGMSAWSAFALRRRDPAFASLWQESLDCAYDVLEARLLARALGDPTAADPANDVTPGTSLTPDDYAAAEAVFDERLAQDLLKRRDGLSAPRSRGGPRVRYLSPEELTDVLEKQLATLRRQLKNQQDADDVG